ncbi:unnamed protein product [Echinostoma caproni]|uniref:Ubiquitinyl hydrolase 1 n=1 Tax=Echinostoma caproni TaxID=27848 RepID=A0A183AES2_9TREM|nr:unnamed protein product [Echinostoma caproni]
MANHCCLNVKFLIGPHVCIHRRGHIKAVWASGYPHGAVFYLDPENNGTAAADSTNPSTWSMESIAKPHRLRIVPIPPDEKPSPQPTSSSSDIIDRSERTAHSTTINTTTIWDNKTVNEFPIRILTDPGRIRHRRG